MRNAPVRTLKMLRDLRVWKISFASNMLMLQIGKKTKVCIEILNIEKIVGLFGLHIQSEWFLYENGLLIMARDTLEQNLDYFSSETKRVSKYLAEKKYVCKSLKYSLGNFEFIFGKFTLKVKKSTYKDDESWRILDNKSNIHHVYEV